MQNPYMGPGPRRARAHVRNMCFGKYILICMYISVYILMFLTGSMKECKKTHLKPHKNTPDAHKHTPKMHKNKSNLYKTAT